MAALGPIHPSNGYPVYYQDFTGLALEQCLDSLDPLCGVLPLPDPLSPVSFPDNFPDEFFYWLGNSTMPTNGGGDALLVVALEGAFGGVTGGVVPGEQIVFGRIRVRVDNLIQGETYVVTHPFGVDTFVAENSAANGINFTEDIGCADLPCDFSLALNGRVGPFLAWDPAESAPPVGYVGDPAIEHTVIGSPLGNNFFRIEGPSVGGPGVDVIQTDLFTIQGKIFTGVVPSPLSVDRSSYSRQSNVTNTADSPPTDVNSVLVDEVTIDVASFDQATSTLTVHASSSDLLGQVGS